MRRVAGQNVFRGTVQQRGIVGCSKGQMYGNVLRRSKGRRGGPLFDVGRSEGDATRPKRGTLDALRETLHSNHGATRSNRSEEAQHSSWFNVSNSLHRCIQAPEDQTKLVSLDATQKQLRYELHQSIHLLEESKDEATFRDVVSFLDVFRRSNTPLPFQARASRALGPDPSQPLQILELDEAVNQLVNFACARAVEHLSSEVTEQKTKREKQLLAKSVEVLHTLLESNAQLRRQQPELQSVVIRYQGLL